MNPVPCPYCDRGTVVHKHDRAMWWQWRTARCGICGGTGLVQPDAITKTKEDA